MHPHSRHAVRAARSLSTTFPAAEKTRSDGAEVAGTGRYLWAKEARAGNRSAFDFHQDRGDNSIFAGFSRRYILLCPRLSKVA